MDAQKATLFQLADGNKQFRIPIYQRAYSWRQEQCSRLLEDVLTIASATPGVTIHRARGYKPFVILRMKLVADFFCSGT